MNKLNLYHQNQNLSHRLLDSIILYMDDLSNPSLSKTQKAQSKDALFTLLDVVVQFMDDSLTTEAKEVLIRIFSRVTHDVAKNDIEALRKNEKYLTEMLKIF